MRGPGGGRNHLAVESNQWTRLKAQLKRDHKPFKAIEEKEQGHGFRDEDRSVQFHEALARFLAANLAP